MARLLVDAGPLIALLVQRDEHHAWATKQLSNVSGPLTTCESVLSEAMHFLEQHTGGVRALRQMLQRGFLEIDFCLSQEVTEVFGLMERYANVPMSLADACLVRMCELDERATLLTADRDFLVYRKHGRQPLSLILPPRE